MDTTSKIITLDPDTWMDAPHVAIGQLTALAPTGVIIDASGAGRIPAQVAQVLAATFRSAQAAETPFEIQNPSVAVVDSLNLLGLSYILPGSP